jgi:hypothetical protein
MTDSKNMTTIEFYDVESQSPACVIVRRCDDRIALTISLKSAGDVEALLDRNSAERLVWALEIALKANGRG